jgi:VanZ family protein
MYRVAAALWLLGWAMFSVPWSSFTPRPQVGQVDLHLFQNRRADQLRNFLYYVPAGVIGLGLGLGTGGTIASAAALSGVAETVQIFSTSRVASVTDLMLNTAGALVGVGLVVLLRSRRSQGTSSTDLQSST